MARHPPHRRGDRHPSRGRLLQALDTEDLWPAVEARQAQRARHGGDSDEEPILLAMSDNGPQMRAGTTREFLALCSIAARFGRPGTPTDQAWIETLFGHVKTEWPHLEKITDPNTLRAELDNVRTTRTFTQKHLTPSGAPGASSSTPRTSTSPRPTSNSQIRVGFSSTGGPSDSVSVKPDSGGPHPAYRGPTPHSFPKSLICSHAPP